MPPKDPMVIRDYVIKNGGFIKTEAGVEIIAVTDAGVASIKADIQDALAEGSIYIGNASGVTSEFDASTTTQILIGNGTTLVSAALSGDTTMTNAGVVTVVSANAAFNVGTNVTWTLEVNHTSIVAASTTAATVGGSLTTAAAAGARATRYCP